jgi:Flp pilus assembly protein TadD
MPTRQTARQRALRKRPRPGRAGVPAAPDQSTRPAASPLFTALAAILLGLPLAVLGRAVGPYDDPKAWALPMLVGLAALVWLARLGHAPAAAPAEPDGPARWVRWVVLGAVAWAVIATAVSAAPAQSVLGSFGRGMGLLTIASSALLFFLVRNQVRGEGDVRELVDAALLGSVPVCVVALGQALGWDPLPKPWDPAIAPMTVRSTLGSHLSLGSYLIMLVPLAAARLEWMWRERAESGGWRRPSRARWLVTLGATAWVAGAVVLIALTASWPALAWALVPWGIVGAVAWTLVVARVEEAADTAVTAVLMAGLLVAQVAIVVLSRGRGAFIGLVVGLSVTAFVLLIRRRAWKTLATAAAGLVVLVAFLALLNVPGSPVARLGKLPLLSRLSEIANIQRGSPGWVRLQVWQGIADGWLRQLSGEEVIPGFSPWVRSLVGYGPETQLLVLEPLTTPFLGALPARGQGWQARYVIDRSHNVLLDHLVTRGLIGVGLWMLLIGSLVVIGVARIRASASAAETAVRVGSLGALIGHVADGQVGMEITIVLVMFWLLAALLTLGPWTAIPALAAAPCRPWVPGRPLWATLMIAAAVATVVAGWAGTRWLLASVAYADGTRHGIAGRLPEAYGEFKRSIALVPWLSLPAEAAAYTALRLAGSEPDIPRKLALLREGQATLVQVRQHATGGADSWALSGQLAFAEARAGRQREFGASQQAFAVALRLRPDDPKLVAQWGWIWLESGDPTRAREAARLALARDPREWLAWTLLARSSRDLGDVPEAERAAAQARALAPRESHRLVDSLVP